MRDHLDKRLPGVIGPEHLWSYAFVDDVARAHVAAVAHPQPAREYVVGGVNAPQNAIYEFLRDQRGRGLPMRVPYAVATAAALALEAFARVSHKPPLLTHGVVEIFRHDWPLDSRVAQRDLSLGITPLLEGLTRTLAALLT
jgi:nucleoside-diphosphate-sugar epimerase